MTTRVQRDFYDVESLAELFRVTPRCIRELAASGEIPSRKIGRRYIFSSVALHEWLAQGRDRVPHGQPSEEFEVSIHQLIDRYRPLMERLANE